MAKKTETTTEETVAKEPKKVAKKAVAKKTAKKVDKKAKPKRTVVRDYTCIAPGCRQKSRGPRFSYLCAKHAKASHAQILEWRAKAAVKRQLAKEKASKK